MTPRRRLDAILLEYPCSYCGVCAGHWCETKHAMTARFLHADRFYQAVDAGRLPLPD